MSDAAFIQVNSPTERELHRATSKASLASEHELRKSLPRASAPIETELCKQASRIEEPKNSTSALYASVLVALMLPFQFGWSLSQLNLSTFARQDDCDARPVVDGTCVMFPGHSKAEWTYVVNAWIVGGMIGSLTSGVLAD
ncbi:hypothetical protein PybrP1_009552, partial [[Pythium] brassicae (nom. inval.)]